MPQLIDRAKLFWALAWVLGGCAQPPANSSPTATPAAVRPSPSRLTCLARLEPEGRLISLRVPASLAQEPVSRWLVAEGASVRRGQPLAHLGAQDRLREEVELARSEVEVARAKLAQVLAGAKEGELRAQGFETERIQLDKSSFLEVQRQVIARAAADLRLQEKEYKRYQALFADGAAPASQLDQKRFGWESSRAQLRQAQEELRRQQSILAAQAAQSQQQFRKLAEVRPTDVALAEAEVHRAQRQLSRAQTLLAESTVRSPQDGVLLRILSRAGEPAGNEGLAQLGQTQNMVAVAEVYDSQIQQVRSGQPVEFHSAALGEQKLAGQVAEIGRTVLKQSVYSGEPGENFDRRIIEVRVRLDPGSSRKVRSLTNLQLEAQFL